MTIRVLYEIQYGYPSTGYGDRVRYSLLLTTHCVPGSVPVPQGVPVATVSESVARAPLPPRVTLSSLPGTPTYHHFFPFSFPQSARPLPCARLPLPAFSLLDLSLRNMGKSSIPTVVNFSM
jgi:hypothetical protein